MTPAILPLKGSSLAHAADVVKSGGLIVYPTDTVYGLGCDPMDEAALERLFIAKRRDAKPIPVMCDSVKSALRLVSLTPRAREVARTYWPGAVTIVAPMRGGLPRLIHQGTAAVGVRVPNSRVCIELVGKCGGILTGTSANVSGRGPCRTAEEASAELGSAVDLILDGGQLEGAESTVVRVLDDRIEVLRQGGVRVTEKDNRR